MHSLALQKDSQKPHVISSIKWTSYISLLGVYSSNCVRREEYSYAVYTCTYTHIYICNCKATRKKKSGTIYEGNLRGVQYIKKSRRMLADACSWWNHISKWNHDWLFIKLSLLHPGWVTQSYTAFLAWMLPWEESGNLMSHDLIFQRKMHMSRGNPWKA